MRSACYSYVCISFLATMRASKGRSCALQVLLKPNRCVCACAKRVVPASLVSPAPGEFLGAPRANHLRRKGYRGRIPRGEQRRPTDRNLRAKYSANHLAGACEYRCHIQWGDPFAPPSREVWQRGASLLFAHAHTPRCEATVRVLGGLPKHCSSQAWPASATTRTRGTIAAMDACKFTLCLKSPGSRTKNRLLSRL